MSQTTWKIENTILYCCRTQEEHTQQTAPRYKQKKEGSKTMKLIANKGKSKYTKDALVILSETAVVNKEEYEALKTVIAMCEKIQAESNHCVMYNSADDALTGLYDIFDNTICEG